MKVYIITKTKEGTHSNVGWFNVSRVKFAFDNLEDAMGQMNFIAQFSPTGWYDKDGNLEGGEVVSDYTTTTGERNIVVNDAFNERHLYRLSEVEITINTD